MAKKVKKQTKNEDKIRPAITPEAKMGQLMALATDLIMSRLLDGTASSQETTSILKFGSEKTKLEIEKLRQENELIKAKTELANSQQSSDEKYAKVIEAMKRYGGHSD